MGRKVKGGHRVTNLTTFAEHRRYREKLNAMGIKLPTGRPPKRRVDGTQKLSQVGKYKARGRWIGDVWFPSNAEADRYEQLVEMQEMGTIADLEVHPTFPCRVNGRLVCTYLADFRYRIKPGKLGSRVLIEDVKGMRTLLYTVKKRLVEALYPIEIIEVPVPKKGTVARYRYLTADQLQGLDLTHKDQPNGGQDADRQRVADHQDQEP
jgi:hypothetical protein